MFNSIKLSPYMDSWKQDFEEEASKIKKILGTNLLEIHHIGSTSIPGIAAKPIIDILPVVQSLDGIDDLKDQFEEAGYLFRGEFGISGRRYIVALEPDNINHRVHIHVFQKGHSEIDRHLYFRDFLKSNVDVAKEYELLKLDLKAKFQFEKDKYQAGKKDFIERVLKGANGAIEVKHQ